MGNTPDPTKKIDRPTNEKPPIKKPSVHDLPTPDKTTEVVKGGLPGLPMKS